MTACEGVETVARIRWPAGKNSGCAWPPGSSRATLTPHRASGEVLVTTGPQDPAAAGRDQLRASHAEREQVIDTLKNAFVHGRLTRDELDARAGQALAARTHADLAALTADIPAGLAAAGPARPPAPARRRPRARPVVAGICLLIAAAAIAAGILLPDDPGGPSPWDGLIVFLFVSGLFTALGIMACTVYTSWDQRSSRGQLPPRPGPGGQRPRRRTVRRHRPWPGSPRPSHRPDPRRPAGSQVTAARSRPGGPGTAWREAGPRHDMTPVKPAPGPALTRLSRPDVNGTKAQEATVTRARG